MPYKEGRKWRATPKRKGERLQTKTFQTKKEALHYERDTVKQAKQQEMRSQKGLDLLVFCSQYQIHCERYSRKTQHEKRGLCNRIIEEWGPEALVSSITSGMVQAFLDKQAQKRSPNGSNKDRKNILSMWNHGILFFGIKENPARDTKPRRHDRKTGYTPPIEDITALRIAAEGKERVLIMSYLCTAARRSEVLRWAWEDDIDFHGSQVRVGTHKTRDGSIKYRWLPMIGELKISLEWLYKHRDKKSPHVFPDYYFGSENWKGEQRANRLITALCEKAKIKAFGFHAIRRFVPSFLLSTGADIKQIQAVLGHGNISVTHRYIEKLRGSMKETFGMLEGLFGEKVHITGTQNKKGVNGNGH
ncbi:MAG: site-specific integrase [Deltaproteobacteria bacterium]|nr:site-specific integrase [Deltaproteobacteria bacterium]